MSAELNLARSIGKPERVRPAGRVAIPRGRPAAQTLAPLALIAANVIWGGSAVATKSVLAHVPPVTLACFRLAVAMAVLGPLVARAGGRPARGSAPMWLGLTGVACFCLFQNVGLQYATAANAALINGGIPVMIAALAALLLHERLQTRQVASLVVSFAGVATVVLIGDGASARMAALTNALPLASAVSFAIYIVLGRTAFGTGSALAIVAGSTRYGLLFLLPVAVVELAALDVAPPVPTLQDIALVLYLGAGCSALAFVLCGYGLRRLAAGQGAIFGNLKPLAGVALALLLLGEPFAASQGIGGALILMGVGLARPTR